MEQKNYTESEILALGKIKALENGGISHSILRALEKSLEGKSIKEIEDFYKNQVTDEAKRNILRISLEIENTQIPENREKKGGYKVVYKSDEIDLSKLEKNNNKKDETKKLKRTQNEESGENTNNNEENLVIINDFDSDENIQDNNEPEKNKDIITKETQDNEENPKIEISEDEKSKLEEAKKYFSEVYESGAKTYIAEIEKAKTSGKNTNEIEKLLNEAKNALNIIEDLNKGFSDNTILKDYINQGGIKNLIDDYTSLAQAEFEKVASNMQKALKLANQSQNNKKNISAVMTQNEKNIRKNMNDLNKNSETEKRKNIIKDNLKNIIKELNLDFNGFGNGEENSRNDFIENFALFIFSKNPNNNFDKNQLSKAIQEFLEYQENINYGNNSTKEEKNKIFEGIYEILNKK